MIVFKNFLLFFLLFITIYSQKSSNTSFAVTRLSLLGGITFTTDSDSRLALCFEGSTNITESIFIKTGLNYTNINEPVNITIKTYDYINIQLIKKYYAISYIIEEKQYQVISIYTGTQYFFINDNIFSPYLNLDFAYNFLDPFIQNSPRTYYGDYDNFEELPNEFKYSHQEYYPLSSFRFTFGVGTQYRVSNTFLIDFRYQYLLDTELINSHQFLVGLTL